MYTLKELEKQTDERFLIIKTPKCMVNFEGVSNGTVLNFTTPIHWIQSVYHLATARIIFIDNYYGILSKTNFRNNVLCIQLWHAAGAVKKFGLQDPSLKYRSKRANRRIRKVYQRFTHVIVGTEKMAAIFQQSFGISDEGVIRSGIPRTDFFYNTVGKQIVKKKLLHQIPVINNKIVILYAPTFRDNDPNSTEIAIDVRKYCDALCDDYVLLLRLHPSIKHDFHNEFPGIVYDVSTIPDVNHLLVITDILITDYSSIPFEFSLLERPMIFFAYDLERYERTRGFWEDYEKLVPGPVVKNTDDLIEVIEEGHFDMQRVREFAALWNQYSTGTSSKQLIKAIYEG
ncbi:CDP-glycerol glycerophosphotransferase family protein [Virgibacillus oceani]|uniref:CDP-glycerol:glycerophosphate glycerophosphotransferase n=1 Tax=Virgibacillus oceani TaxID=1479511 RepID=A0A917HAN7_9BACI|nr:CDP-glycerol glycerophosphotransferase family protein [Virgibacillus oceani]GGG73478.1 hypothetical protein GCM10011398_17430 [Virgibacillus oceani]